MSRLIAFPLAFAASILAGCATSSVAPAAAAPTPKERIFYTQKVSTKSPAKAVFVRDTGFTGAGVYKHLSINGEKAASLDVGERADFVLEPGEYVFSVIPTDAFGTHNDYAIDQVLQPGRTYFYRVLTDGNSMMTRIQRVANQSVSE